MYTSLVEKFFCCRDIILINIFNFLRTILNWSVLIYLYAVIYKMYLKKMTTTIIIALNALTSLHYDLDFPIHPCILLLYSLYILLHQSLISYISHYFPLYLPLLLPYIPCNPAPYYPLPIILSYAIPLPTDLCLINHIPSYSSSPHPSVPQLLMTTSSSVLHVCRIKRLTN